MKCDNLVSYIRLYWQYSPKLWIGITSQLDYLLHNSKSFFCIFLYLSKVWVLVNTIILDSYRLYVHWQKVIKIQYLMLFHKNGFAFHVRNYAKESLLAIVRFIIKQKTINTNVNKTHTTVSKYCSTFVGC